MDTDPNIAIMELLEIAIANVRNKKEAGYPKEELAMKMALNGLSPANATYMMEIMVTMGQCIERNGIFFGSKEDGGFY